MIPRDDLLVTTRDGSCPCVMTIPEAPIRGFAVPDNPTHDPAAAARHLNAVGDLVGETLVS